MYIYNSEVICFPRTVSPDGELYQIAGTKL